MVGRRLRRGYHLVVTVLVLAGGCSTPGTPPQQAGHRTIPEPVDTPSAEAPGEEILMDMLAAAGEALTLGHHADAIDLYSDIALIAPGTVAAGEASRKLGDVVGALALEPGAEWFAADGTQLTGTTRGLAAEGRPLPSVIVTIAEGPARVAVRGLALDFAYSVAGSQVDSVIVRTSEFGTASAPSPAGLSSASDLTVLVTPVVSTTYGTRPLSASTLAFRYKSAAALFGVAGVQLSGGKGSIAADIGDAMVDHLGGVGAVVTADDQAVGDILAVSTGNMAAVTALANRLDSALLAIAVVDIQKVTQVEYQGRVYDIWKTEAVVRFTIYDPAGAHTVISFSSDVLAGQGGSEPAAVTDTVRVAAALLRDLLQDHDREVRALAGGRSE